MITATLRNDFHNTSVLIRVPARGYVTRRTYLRWHAALCGSDTCTCGVVRGPQDEAIEIDTGWRGSPYVSVRRAEVA